MVNPVIPDVGEDGDVMVAVPETTDHSPVPTVGVFPAKVVVVAQATRVWFVPALAVVGGVVQGIGFKAIKIPPFWALPESLMVLFPVLPAVVFIAHAAPTDVFCPLLFFTSYNSEKVSLVVFQFA
jgi:hypothetical protein